MDNLHIYLSGAMQSLSLEEQSNWRQKVIDDIMYDSYGYKKYPLFFNPVDFYNFEEVRYKTQREVMEFDLNALRKSDLIVVNFNNPSSLGTCSELAIAYEMRIPIVGINKWNKKLHPWLVEFTTRMCESVEEAIDYVKDFYLN